MIRADIAIVGAGMAGASLTTAVAPHASVVIIEGETQPGYHATGRSAAFWSETYGGPDIRPLTTASRAWLAHPPCDFADKGFLRTRGAIHLADTYGRPALRELSTNFAESGVALEPLDRADLETRIPGLRAGWDNGLLEPGTADIDVAALHDAFLRAARRSGAVLVVDAPLKTVEREAGGWRLAVGAETVTAKVLVNAAGAWADDVAILAGAAPLGIRPYRRTIIQLRVDPPVAAELPLVIDAAGRFYFKPEPGGRLWLSPHDETPASAGDAKADDGDIASAITRLERVVDWRIVQTERAWAGLRSFAPDRLPVFGFDGDVANFFWFAGQGGFGIQIAPAAARVGAALLLGRSPDAMVARIDPELYSPKRFTR